MFTWITGPRITNVIEDLQPENHYESTFLEPPETPAHQFAVNAFKHALFGTPAPDDPNAAKQTERQAKVDAANGKNIVITPPPEDAPLLSPSKQPGGILMTPGTASKGRKTVSFGSQVVDNEGKRGNFGRSGIPNDCPGKFPSPWTPGTQPRLELGSDKRPRTKFTEALLDARTTTQPKPGQKLKAKDDSDITIDLGAPRSESGKYWKEQYESYAQRSEKEMKKVVAKQQLAKKFAMKKDAEVTDLMTKFEQERKKFRQRERELEQQNNEFQERLRQALADNASATVEIAALKRRITVLERPSSTMQEKPSFQIFEDRSKDAIRPTSDEAQGADLSFAPSISTASSGKENRSPEHRRQRRQSDAERPARPSAPPRLGVAQGEASIILGRSPHAPKRSSRTEAEVITAFAPSEQIPRSPLRTRNAEPTKDQMPSSSPDAMLPSSPLPMPSPGIEPDPWMGLSIQAVDKLAMPNYSGKPFSRPEWEPAPKPQRASKAISHTRNAALAKLDDQRVERSSDVKAETSVKQSRPGKAAQDLEKQTDPTGNGRKYKDGTKKTTTEIPKDTIATSNHSPTDPKFDLSKITAHHAEGSSQVEKDRTELPPADRKELARQRLEERKKLRKKAPA
ncbi:hypothetical protein ACEQ8H_000436 [Pleosporales sp. CAS-2024a]